MAWQPNCAVLPNQARRRSHPDRSGDLQRRRSLGAEHHAVGVGTLGWNDWYTSNVALTWTSASRSPLLPRQDRLRRSSDQCRSVVQRATPAPRLVRAVGRPCQRRDQAGRLGADRHGSPAPAANAAGWYNADVTLNWTCADAARPASSRAPLTMSLGEGPGLHRAACGPSATTRATPRLDEQSRGQHRQDGRRRIGIGDERRESPDAAYTWTNQNVVVSYGCTDGLSGVATTPAADTVSTESATGSASGNCVDELRATAPRRRSARSRSTRRGRRSAAQNPADDGRVERLVQDGADRRLHLRRRAVGRRQLRRDGGSGPSVTLGEDALARPSKARRPTTPATRRPPSVPASRSICPIPRLRPGKRRDRDGASYYFGSVPAAPSCSSSDAISGIASCVVSGRDTDWSARTRSRRPRPTSWPHEHRDPQLHRSRWTLNGFYQPVDMNRAADRLEHGQERLDGATQVRCFRRVDRADQHLGRKSAADGGWGRLRGGPCG